MAEPPRLGSWARADGFVGIVARVEDDAVTLFHPGHRTQTVVGAEEVEAVPAAAVTVTATVDLPLAHGLEEAEVRRWVASLLDESLRDRALSALAQAGIDEGAALPTVRLSVTPMASGGAVCLCGAKMPAPAATGLACPACGREAVAPPASGSSGG